MQPCGRVPSSSQFIATAHRLPHLAASRLALKSTPDQRPASSPAGWGPSSNGRKNNGYGVGSLNLR